MYRLKMQILKSGQTNSKIKYKQNIIKCKKVIKLKMLS